MVGEAGEAVNLYVTADKVGTASGGGLVTYHESEALKELGECEVWDRDYLSTPSPGWMPLTQAEPWLWDENALSHLFMRGTRPELCHIYAGTFTRTIAQALKGNVANGDKPSVVTTTCAAHSIEESRREHYTCGIDYDKLYNHLVDPELWKRYSRGYMEADVLIVPSTHSEKVVREQGRKGRVEVIPHGVDLPETTKPIPTNFVVGYLGSCSGPDKGVRYLLEAWGKLNYRDGLLILGGRDSTSPYVRSMVQTYGGNVHLRGWVSDVSDFYNYISVYIQPSVSEGYGIEVLEAMAHARPVICSTGAGAHDVVPLGPELSQFKVSPRDVDDLCSAIDYCRKKGREFLYEVGRINREEAAKYSWHLIRQRYQTLWRSL